MAEPNARPSADGDAMLVELRVDAILAGAAFRAGAVLAVAPTLQHLALQLIEAGAAVEASDRQAA